MWNLLFIKIGSQIGAFNTVLLIIITAIVGVTYARYEVFNTKIWHRTNYKEWIASMWNNFRRSTYFCNILILPGFATDAIGILLIIPLTRKIFLSKFVKKNKNGYKNREKNNNFIEGEYEDINENDDKKIWNNF